MANDRRGKNNGPKWYDQTQGKKPQRTESEQWGFGGSRREDRRGNSRTDRFANAERPAYGKPPERGERPSYGRPPERGERPAYGRPPERGERPAYGRPPERGERPAYGKPPERSERPAYGKPTQRGERPVYNRPPVAPARAPEYAPDFEQDADLPRENLLAGRNPIREALKSGRDMEKILVARGELSGSARELVAMAKERHIVVQEVDRVRLDALASGHQGMIAFASAFRYSTLEDMLALAEERKQPPLLMILDGITDPHNLGAIIRTAECTGAHGVIIPERRAVGLTPAAVKASAGAVEYLPVARVGNIARLIEQLKEKGIWTYAAVLQGERYDRCDLSGPAALVIGAEGEGVSRLVMEKCDHRVALPLCGRIESLNASVAAGVLLYEALRRRQAEV